MITISSNFDAGNIRTVRAESADDIELAIVKDHQSDFYQWFYFRLQGAAGECAKMTINNAAGAAYPDGWEDYRAVASYDRQHWFRVPTDYVDGQLVIDFEVERDSVYLAYFAPYSYERHLDLLGFAESSEFCRSQHLGSTLDGRDMTLLTLHSGDDSKPNIWITARQHPGETMAEWFMEGMLERLLDPEDAQAGLLRESANFYIVPNMNPDGSVRGHLRTNAAGVNLNREWGEPSMEKSPEVYLVRQAMFEHGVDLFIDAHGDEALPCNFIAGQAGAPVAQQILDTEATFEANWQRANPDFQTERGYATDRFGPETMTIAAFWVGGQFGCPSMTVEMPFKDYDLRPDPECGWSPVRSAKLGASVLDPIALWLADNA